MPSLLKLYLYFIYISSSISGWSKITFKKSGIWCRCWEYTKLSKNYSKAVRRWRRREWFSEMAQPCVWSDWWHDSGEHQINRQRNYIRCYVKHIFWILLCGIIPQVPRTKVKNGIISVYLAISVSNNAKWWIFHRVSASTPSVQLDLNLFILK